MFPLVDLACILVSAPSSSADEAKEVAELAKYFSKESGRSINVNKTVNDQPAFLRKIIKNGWSAAKIKRVIDYFVRAVNQRKTKRVSFDFVFSYDEQKDSLLSANFKVSCGKKEAIATLQLNLAVKLDSFPAERNLEQAVDHEIDHIDDFNQIIDSSGISCPRQATNDASGLLNQGVQYFLSRAAAYLKPEEFTRLHTLTERLIKIYPAFQDQMAETRAWARNKRIDRREAYQISIQQGLQSFGGSSALSRANMIRSYQDKNPHFVARVAVVANKYGLSDVSNWIKDMRDSQSSIWRSDFDASYNVLALQYDIVSRNT